MSAAAASHELFVRVTGREPESHWSAPGRVNLIGEHTDYNDGFVFPFATPHRTHVQLRRRDDGVIRVASTFDDDVVEVPLGDLDDIFPAARERVPEWARYPLGVAWAILRTAGRDAASVSGVDIAIASDVPVGAGLSSSAAIENATALALDDAWQLEIARTVLAEAGRTAENEAVGAPTGIMDQMSSMLGEHDHALFLDCRSLHSESVALGFDDAGLELLVIDTRVSHAHSTGGYRDRRDACERGARAMGVPALRDLTIADLERASDVLDEVTFRRVRHIVTENARVEQTVRTLRERGPLYIGELLLASHASMRDDFEISVPELDTAVEAARGAGALGARMTGGGFGGAAIALVPADRVVAVAAAVETAFGEASFRAPHIFPVVPSRGAGREE